MFNASVLIRVWFLNRVLLGGSCNTGVSVIYPEPDFADAVHIAMMSMSCANRLNPHKWPHYSAFGGWVTSSGVIN